MATTTMQELNNAVGRINDAARTLGLIADNETVMLETGNKTYGIAFKLWLKRGESHAHHSVRFGDSFGFIGQTRREAALSLWATVRALEGVADMLARKARGES